MKKLFVNEEEIPESAIQAALEQMMNFYAMQGVPPEALKEHMDELIATAQEQVIGGQFLDDGSRQDGDEIPRCCTSSVANE